MKDTVTKVEDKEKANEIIENFIQQIGDSITSINSWNIAPIESQLLFLLHHGLKINDEFAVQLMATLGCFENIVLNQQEGINVAIKAGNDEKGKLDIARDASVKEALAAVNITDIANKYLQISKAQRNDRENLNEMVPAISIENLNLTFNSRQLVVNQFERYGGYLFKMKVSQLKEKDQDWLDVLGVVLVSALGIVAGVALMALPGAGVFLATFGASLIGGGISDLVNAGFSLLTGKIIEFGKYISSKGISLAVSAIASGALYLLQKLSEAYNIAWLNMSKKIKDMKESVSHTSEYLVNGFGDTIKTKLIVGVTNNFLARIGNKMIDKEGIKSKAKDAIEGVFTSTKELLIRLIATDYFCKNRSYKLCQGRQGVIDTLHKEVKGEFARYRGSLGLSASAEFATQATAQTMDHIVPGMGSLADVMTHGAANQIDNSRVISDMVDNIRAVITGKEVYALTTSQIFEVNLLSHFGPDNGELLAGELNAKKLNINDQFNCTKLSEVRTSEKFAKYNVIGVCNETKEVLYNQGVLESSKENFAADLSQLKVQIQEDFVSIVSSYFSTHVANEVLEAMDYAEEKLGDVFGKLFAKAQERKDAGEDIQDKKEKTPENLRTKAKGKNSGRKNDRSNSETGSIVTNKKHVTNSDESLADIAKQYDAPTSELKRANPQLKNRQVREGEEINIPSKVVIPVNPAKSPVGRAATFAKEHGAEIASGVVDAIPYVGTAKGMTEVISGYDPVTGAPISRWVSVPGLLLTVIPIPGLKLLPKGIKAASKGLYKLAKRGNAVERIAAKVAKEEAKIEGIIYKRIDQETGKIYIGQAKSEENYLLRQQVHDRRFKKKRFYNILEENVPTKSKLDYMEETWIRNSGGPQSKGGTLANKRSQMNEQRYQQAKDKFNKL